MSTHLWLETLEGERHPSFVFEYAGARDLLKIIDQVPAECRLNKVGGGDVWKGAEPVWRPTDLPAFREGIAERIDYNREQFEQLCDALADGPEYWIYFSI